MKTINGTIRNRIIYRDNDMILEAYPEAIHVWLFNYRIGAYVHDSYWSEGRSRIFERELNTGRLTGRTASPEDDIPEIVREKINEQISNYF